MSIDPKIKAYLAENPKLSAEERLQAVVQSEFANLMRQPGFRLVLMYVIDHPNLCGVAGTASELDAHPTMDGQRIALATYKRIGAQDIGRHLFGWAMRTSSDMYRRMTAEYEDLMSTIAGSVSAKE